MSRNTFILALALVGLVASALLISTRFDSIALADESDALTTQETPEMLSYRVLAGDNLYQISQKFYGNGRFWQEIANENGFKSAIDLKAGQEIRIPVLSRDAINASNVIEEASAAVAQPLGMRPDETLAASADADRFDANAPFFSDSLNFGGGNFEHVTANLKALDGKAQLSIKAVVGDFYQELYNEDIRPIGGTFRFAFKDDANHDGRDEIYTVWQVGDDPYFTKEIAWNGSRYTHTATHPAAPFAQEHEPEAFSASAEIEHFIKNGKWTD